MGKPKDTISIDADLWETVKNKLLLVEAWADGLREECYNTRILIQKAGGGSPPPNDQSGLSDRELAEISARRRKRVLRSAKSK